MKPPRAEKKVNTKTNQGVGGPPARSSRSVVASVPLTEMETPPSAGGAPMRLRSPSSAAAFLPASPISQVTSPEDGCQGSGVESRRVASPRLRLASFQAV
ncbi:hypothetical protein CRUP_008635 [Coryphaenoides rupestris]|nr:hypothetical protein CRUP_008635 [Coryphaenoides rupestris]